MGIHFTGNFMDYTFPFSFRNDPILKHTTQKPQPHLNPLGAKGIGEASTIGSTPAVQNAVIDAISHLGVRHLDMPCTPERVWNAINDAKNGTLQDPWTEPPAIFDQLSK